MNTPNPAQVAANRTARLVREAQTPVFTSTREGAWARAMERLVRRADEFTGPEFCHICKRATDHRGEHSDEEMLRFSRTPLGSRLMETW